MKVSRVIEICETTCLRNLDYEEDEILPLLNLALLEVYKRFGVYEKEETIALTSGVYEYALDAEHLFPIAAFTTEEYWKDDDGDLMGGGEVGEEIEMPIGDEKSTNSVYFLRPGYCKTLYPTTGQTITIKFLKSATDIEASGTDSNIDLDDQYITALVAYVGYLGHEGYPGLEGQSSMSAQYLAKFEKAVLDTKNMGLERKRQPINDKLDRRGFA